MVVYSVMAAPAGVFAPAVTVSVSDGERSAVYATVASVPAVLSETVPAKAAAPLGWRRIVPLGPAVSVAASMAVENSTASVLPMRSSVAPTTCGATALQVIR